MTLCDPFVRLSDTASASVGTGRRGGVSSPISGLWPAGSTFLPVLVDRQTSALLTCDRKAEAMRNAEVKS